MDNPKFTRAITPEDDSRKESDSRKAKRQDRQGYGIGTRSIAIAGTVALAAVLAACAPNQVTASEGPTTSNSAEPNPSNTNETENPVGAGGFDPENYFVDVENMSELSNDQLQKIASIEVSSVIDENEQIDWTKVVESMADRLEAMVMAGNSPAEMEALYLSGGDPDSYSQRFNNALASGLFVEGFNLSTANRENITTAAFKSNLTEGERVWYTVDVSNISIVEQSDSGATVNYSQTLRDNVFSSGGFSPDNSNDVAKLQRSEDLNVTNNLSTIFVIENGLIKIFGSVVI